MNIDLKPNLILYSFQSLYIFELRTVLYLDSPVFLDFQYETPKFHADSYYAFALNMLHWAYKIKIGMVLHLFCFHKNMGYTGTSFILNGSPPHGHSSCYNGHNILGAEYQLTRTTISAISASPNSKTNLTVRGWNGYFYKNGL